MSTSPMPRWRVRPPSPQPVMRHRPDRRAGFTLLELLVSIAIIALLIALLAPSFDGLRTRSRITRDLAYMNGHVKAFTVYTNDHDEYWPALTDPRATFTVLTAEDNQRVPIRYFDIHIWWHLLLSRPMYDLPPWAKPFGDRRPPGLITITDHWYSPSFLADPQFFNQSTRTGRQQYRATRAHEVTFPANKALFVNGEWVARTKNRTGGLRGDAPMAFVDASAAIILDEHVVTGYPSGVGDFGGSEFLHWAFPGLVTIDGVRGRDRR